MSRHRVAHVDELDEGKIQSFDVAGRSVILVKWHGEVFALRNICPHQSQSLVGGTACAWVHGQLPQAANGSSPDPEGPPWDLVAEDETPVVRCPWHMWEFRLRDGQCGTNPRFRIRAYETEVEGDGSVFLVTARG